MLCYLSPKNALWRWSSTFRKATNGDDDNMIIFRRKRVSSIISNDTCPTTTFQLERTSGWAKFDSSRRWSTCCHGFFAIPKKVTFFWRHVKEKSKAKWQTSRLRHMYANAYSRFAYDCGSVKRTFTTKWFSVFGNDVDQRLVKTKHRTLQTAIESLERNFGQASSLLTSEGIAFASWK